MLIDLSSPKSEGLAYHPPPSGFDGPTDDVVQFAFSAKTEGKAVISLPMYRYMHECVFLYLGVAMFICNFEPFGYIIKPESHSSVEAAAKLFTDFKLETLGG